VDEQGILLRKKQDSAQRYSIPDLKDDDLLRTRSQKAYSFKQERLILNEFDDAVRSVSATSDLLDFGAIETLKEDPIKSNDNDFENDINDMILEETESREESKNGDSFDDVKVLDFIQKPVLALDHCASGKIARPQ